ncbi:MULTISPECIES: ABC transporter permease [unclassified Streptomyces]|uniref:ABC transporter permease n=1 Tax=unclassified Streptomyces TaxID=2593676 RepID=UPI002E75CD4C|nr:MULTISPECIES: iron ABC transporter permease [unclassified Streptomyces]MEE1764780.1 iron ABC transporter permease [Streptomyces sp. SP18BB07]MEE1837647.1 iron ABC transporter permease [Streptomyces sp. SP17KL33]
MPRPALACGALLAVGVALIPLAYLGIRAGEAGWDRITEELLTERTGALIGRSLALAAVVTSACTVLGVAAAFLVTRTDLPARRLFGVLAALPLAIPSYVAAFAWVSAVEDFEGFWAAALVLALVSYPYVYLPVAAALVGVDPAQEEVALSLGRGPWRMTLGVTLRQVRPAVAAGALLVALYVLSDFGAVSILRVNVLTRAVFTLITLGFDRTGALVLATALVALTTLVLLAEQLSRRRAARYARLGGGAPRPPTRLRLGRWRGPAVLGLASAIGAALGVPAVSLVRWFGEGVSRPGSLGELADAAGNSLWVSLLGTALTLVLALPVGLLSARVPGLPAVALDRLAYLSHALPGLVIGLSLVFFGINVAYPLYQSVWLLALAYAALFLPLAVAAVHGAAAQAPPVLEDVARSLGRRRAYVLRTVTLPLAAPGIGAGAALVFLTCMKELPATLLLRPTGMDTLATGLWKHTSVAAYAAAAPYAALLVLIAAVPTWWLSAHTGVLTRTGG